MSPNSAPIQDVRSAAAKRFASLGWPDKSVEAFKFTPLDRLTARAIDIAQSAEGMRTPLSVKAAQIQFNAGLYDAANSDDMPAGVTLSALDADGAAQTRIFANLPEAHPVANLSFAQMSAGLMINVSAETARDGALALDFAGGTRDSSAFPVICIEMEAGSHLRLIENHHSANGLSAPLVLIRVGDGAELHHVRLQNEAPHADFVALTQIHAGADIKLNSFTVSKGAQLARCETHLDMQGEEAEISLSHIYLGTDNQVLDITTRLNHGVPNCRSNQLIRGVLDDKARGVFQGMVRVAPDAQKTDGQQMSRALLLSRDAEADAKPELEIFADDVVCSHGATVGELDETHLFYLKSRGIAEADARALLIEAFLIDGLEQIEDSELAEFLTTSVQDWAANATKAKDA